MTVRMVESNREQFVHVINDTELRSRKNFVVASTDRIQQVKNRMNSDDIKAKLDTDEKRKAKAAAAAQSIPKLNQQDEEFVQYNNMKAQALIKQQDQTLDELDHAVVRVGRMAETIQDEIGQQNKMLQEVDEDMDDAQQKLGFVTGKLSKMLKTKNKWQIWTIILLALIVFFLFFLVINF
jgi:syntaxin 6